MLQAINGILQTALGLGIDKLTVPQMLLRTVIVYAFMVLIVRWGDLTGSETGSRGTHECSCEMVRSSGPRWR
jgi:hypothetical protein